MTMQQSIHIHGTVTLPDGSQEHCYPNDADGMPFCWSVYRRIETPNDPQQPFDIVDEADFMTLEAAITRADTLARMHAIHPDDIERDY